MSSPSLFVSIPLPVIARRRRRTSPGGCASIPSWGGTADATPRVCFLNLSRRPMAVSAERSVARLVRHLDVHVEVVAARDCLFSAARAENECSRDECSEYGWLHRARPTRGRLAHGAGWKGAVPSDRLGGINAAGRTLISGSFAGCERSSRMACPRRLLQQMARWSLIVVRGLSPT